MKGLIIKDFINLKKNLKIFVILTLLYGVMSFTQKDSGFFTSIFTMLFAILTMSIYSYDELAKWDSFALTMPVSKKIMVQEKYIMMLLLTLIGTFFSIICSFIINNTLNKSIFQGVEASLIGAAIVIIFYSITIPFITKLGVEKSRYIFFVIYIIPFLLVTLGSKVIKKLNIPKPEGLDEMIVSMIKHANIILPVIIVIALFLSYHISVLIYQKKEF